MTKPASAGLSTDQGSIGDRAPKKLLALVAPRQRELFDQHRWRQLRWLPPVHNRFDDRRRQQRQPQHSAHVGLINLLGGGDLGDRRVRTVLQHFTPAECPGDGLDHRVVDTSMGTRTVMVTEAEIEVFEAWFGDLFDELFSTRH